MRVATLRKFRGYTQDILRTSFEIRIRRGGGFAERVRRHIQNLPDEERDYDGVSSLYNVCSRLEFYTQLLGKRVSKYRTYKSKLSTTVGTKIHELFQDGDPQSGHFLEPWLVGFWECSSCSVVTDLSYRPTQPCVCTNTMSESQKRKQRWIYCEIEFVDKIGNVKGHIDGVLIVGDKIYILDIKTTQSRYFKQLDSPKVDNVHQLICYLHLMLGEPGKEIQRGLKVLGVNPHSFENLHGILLYYCPDERDFKSYEVKPKAGEAGKVYGESMKRLAEKRRIRKIFQDPDQDVPPLPERICDDPKCTRAFFCVYAKECFNDRFNAKWEGT